MCVTFQAFEAKQFLLWCHRAVSVRSFRWLRVFVQQKNRVLPRPTCCHAVVIKDFSPDFLRKHRLIPSSHDPQVVLGFFS